MHTTFRIASITKVFTALMTLQYRDQNHLSLDDALSKHLPEFRIQNPFETTRSITLRQLASHMAGLPVNAPCEDIAHGCNMSYDKLYDNIAKLQLIAPPGQAPRYSNLGFGALGRALEKVDGSLSWEDLLQKLILDPLEMKSSGVNFTEQVKESLAIGYNSDGTEAGKINFYVFPFTHTGVDNYFRKLNMDPLTCIDVIHA